MIAIVTPNGRQPYMVPLVEPPEFASEGFGGYSEATIYGGHVPHGSDDRMLYGDVTLYGVNGPVWYGVVESVHRDGSIHCVGPQQVMGWHRMTGGTYTNPTINTLINGVRASLAASIPWLYNDTTDGGYINSNTTALATMDVNEESIADRTALAVSYDSWEWGWYHERIGDRYKCVPHYYQATTTPAYTIRLSAEDADGLTGQGLQDTANKVRVVYGPNNTVSDTTDSDLTHYLPTTGRDKWARVDSANSPNATLAGKVAAAYLRVNSRSLAGSVRSSVVQTATGIPAYLPSVRPGQLARVYGLPQGPVLLRISSVRCMGEHVAEVGLGVDSGRLDALLAKIG